MQFFNIWIQNKIDSIIQGKKSKGFTTIKSIVAVYYRGLHEIYSGPHGDPQKWKFFVSRTENYSTKERGVNFIRVFYVPRASNLAN